MLTTNDQTITISGNVGDNAQAMTIDPEAMQHIMQVLTSMYSDNRAAVVREYVANAIDSHTEAKQTRPVEVITPSIYEPSLVIRDFGVGLNREELLNVYSVYGKSTRRSSNEGIGGFGIGSKSGFTLAGQFVVTGIKGGVKTVALFSLNEDGAPTVEVLSEKNTDEPNGVTVSIAVDDVNKVRDAVSRLSLVWPKGKVLVDGVVPTSVYDDATSITENIFSVHQSWGFTVDMGGVPYRINDTLLHDIQNTLNSTDIAHFALRRIRNYQLGIIARLPIGSVSIAPNRESLSNTTKTQNALTDILRKVGAEHEKAVNDVLKNSKSVHEVFANLVKFESLVGSEYLRNLHYRGHKLDAAIIPRDNRHITLQYARGGKRAVLSNDAMYVRSFHTDVHYSNFVFITGVAEADTNKVMRISTRYLKANPEKTLILVDSAKGNYDWLTWGYKNSITTSYTLDEYRAECKKLPSLAANGEVVYTYCWWNDSRKYWDTKVETGTVIGENAEGNIYNYEGRSVPSRLYRRLLKKGDIVVLLSRGKKVEPLEKRLGQSTINLAEAWDKYVDECKENISELDRLAIGCYSNLQFETVRDTLRSAGYTSKVLDDIVSDYKKVTDHLAKMDSDEVSFLRGICRDTDNTIESRYDDWAERYLLIEAALSQAIRYSRRYETAYLQHMVEYMKAIDSKEDN